MAKGLRKDPSQPDIDLEELHKVSSRLTSKVCISCVCLSRSSPDHLFTLSFAPRHIFLATIPDATEASWAQGFWAPPGRLLELYQKQVPGCLELGTGPMGRYVRILRLEIMFFCDR